jgi:GrpB-like predicted nucleotidyltransferase (UPF0157 family)
MIEIVPYNPNWPNMFETEATIITDALGDNCLEIHHIGSTSVPGLAAKPIIDIIPVVSDITKVDNCNPAMESLGYKAMGEYGIPLRRYFQKGSNTRTHNIHVFEQNNSEIARHLKFRDWMCKHPEDRQAYAKLKIELALNFKNDIFSYCLGKEDFIAEIDKRSGWFNFRFVKALTPKEWNATKHFRDQYFLKLHGISDPYVWTLNHEEHAHLVLYQCTDIVSYAHIQFLENKKAAIQMITIDENKGNKNIKGEFLPLIEKWLKSLGIEILHTECR